VITASAHGREARRLLTCGGIPALPCILPRNLLLVEHLALAVWKDQFNCGSVLRISKLPSVSRNEKCQRLSIILSVRNYSTLPGSYKFTSRNSIGPLLRNLGPHRIGTHHANIDVRPVTSKGKLEASAPPRPKERRRTALSINVCRPDVADEKQTQYRREKICSHCRLPEFALPPRAAPFHTSTQSSLCAHHRNLPENNCSVPSIAKVLALDPQRLIQFPDTRCSPPKE
jgi:hypothetical protein